MTDSYDVYVVGWSPWKLLRVSRSDRVGLLSSGGRGRGGGEKDGLIDVNRERSASRAQMAIKLDLCEELSICGPRALGLHDYSISQLAHLSVTIECLRHYIFHSF